LGEHVFLDQSEIADEFRVDRYDDRSSAFTKLIEQNQLQDHAPTTSQDRSFSYDDAGQLAGAKSITETDNQVEERPSITYADVGGCKEQIEKLREVVELPLLEVGLSFSVHEPS